MKRFPSTAVFLLVVWGCAAPGGARAASRSPQAPLLTRDVVKLPDVAEFYGMRLRGPAPDGPYRLVSEWSTVELDPSSRRASFNGVEVWLHTAMRKVDDEWGMANADVRGLLDPLLRSRVYVSGRGAGVIVLDPGHGGKDAGATGAGGTREKDVVLDVARTLRGYLVQSGFTVHLTREGDRYLSLGARSAVARRREADCFVSIHVNAAANEQAGGVETFILTASGYPSTNSRDQRRVNPVRYRGDAHRGGSAVLGYHLQRGLLERTGAVDRGVRRARFAVLKNTDCPAALVELGFISSAREEARLKSAAYRDRLARGLYKGILEYAATVQRAELAP